eukprot:scpid75964/ scgid10306/ 
MQCFAMLTYMLLLSLAITQETIVEGTDARLHLPRSSHPGSDTTRANTVLFHKDQQAHMPNPKTGRNRRHARTASAGNVEHVRRRRTIGQVVPRYHDYMIFDKILHGLVGSYTRKVNDVVNCADEQHANTQQHTSTVGADTAAPYQHISPSEARSRADPAVEKPIDVVRRAVESLKDNLGNTFSCDAGRYERSSEYLQDGEMGILNTVFSQSLLAHFDPVGEHHHPTYVSASNALCKAVTLLRWKLEKLNAMPESELFGGALDNRIDVAVYGGEKKDEMYPDEQSHDSRMLCKAVDLLNAILQSDAFFARPMPIASDAHGKSAVAVKKSNLLNTSDSRIQATVLSTSPVTTTPAMQTEESPADQSSSLLNNSVPRTPATVPSESPVTITPVIQTEESSADKSSYMSNTYAPRTPATVSSESTV